MGKNIFLRVSVYDPIKKKTVYKTITSLKKYNNSEDDAKKYLEEWKAQQLKTFEDKKIEPKVEPEDIKTNEPTEGQQPEEQKQEHTEEKKPIEPTEGEKIKGNPYNVENIEIPYTEFKLNIEPLDKTGTTTLLLGSSKSGKSTQVIKILNEIYTDKKIITVMMADNGLNAQIYKGLSKDIFIMDKFDPQLIKICNRLQKKSKNKYAFCFSLDDMIMNHNSPHLLKMILTMRNAKISTVICLQDMFSLSKKGRHNINNVIFRKQNNSNGIEEIMKNFLGGYPPFNKLNIMDQIRLYQRATENYSFIYLDALNGKLTFHRG